MDVNAGFLPSRYRLTKQRAAVLRALDGGGHLSAEVVHARVRSELPSVSLGTIYRTLEILRDLGLVQVFSFDGGAARYETALDKHFHLMCTRCRELLNVKASGVAEIAGEIATQYGYRDIDWSLTVVGRCLGCSEKEAISAGRNSSSGGNSP
jgi:Fe2+ or Zn2+ uptake regulation protein